MRLTKESHRFEIITSNRLEILAANLANRMAVAPLDPFHCETIVVQSQGTARWLTLELAQRHGIAAGLDMPLPRRFCHELADRVLGVRVDSAGTRPFDREALVWAVFADMACWPQEPTFAVPVRYLENDPDQRKRYQLACRIAALFDAYQIYRPDMALEWERGKFADLPEHAIWQGHLWKRLVARHPGEPHLARRMRLLIERLRAARDEPPGLPSRLSAFAVTILPPIVVELLVAVAKFVPVTVYLLSPTFEYWGDVRSQRDAARLRTRVRARGSHVDEDTVSVGNELLAALGRQGRDFFNLLQQADSTGTAWHELDFLVPPRDSALHVLQADVVTMAGCSTGTNDRVRVDADDDSLEFHVCHSPMREMEVLRDRLLGAFADDPSLRPHDVIVMVPDIDRYVPHISAVFGVARDGEPNLPFRIADRRAGEENPGVQAVLAVLDLIGGRAPASGVLALLEFPVVRNACGIQRTEIETVAGWVRRANIRWGIDGSHRREAFGLPEEGAHTWRAGLDRLVMGYATGSLDELVARIAPLSAGDPDLLGRLTGWTDRLFSFVRGLSAPRPVARWVRDLDRLIEALCVPVGPAEEEGLQLVRDAIDGLGVATSVLGEAPLDFWIVRTFLEERMAGDGFAHGFITGAITFCALEPMRAIPFQTVCVAGLDNHAFPRRDRRSRLDLMTADPRACDRSRAADDRYLFLETLLAAGKRLILSYTGRSPRDNSEIAPSAVVAELLDQVDRTFEVEGYLRPRDRFVVEHPLHAFDARYFDGSDPRLWSFSREGCTAACQVAGERHGGTPFVSGPVTEVRLENIELSDLVTFWKNPSRYFCHRVLDIDLVREESDEGDSEPFAIAGLDRFRLAEEMLARRYSGPVLPEREYDLLQASGALPAGGLGRVAYRGLYSEVSGMLDRMADTRWVDPIPVDLRGSDWRITGVIEGVSAEGPLACRFAALQGKHVTPVWIELLILAATADPSDTAAPPLRARVVGRSETWTLSPPPSNGKGGRGVLETLEALVEGFRCGHVRPLPVFGGASRELVETLRKTSATDADLDEAIKKARSKLYGSRYTEGRADVDDPYVALCFRDTDPTGSLREEFVRWSRVLWDPILDQSEITKP